MYFYSITETDDYDKYKWAMVSHEKSFTEREFNDICKKAEQKIPKGGYFNHLKLAKALEEFGFKHIEPDIDYAIL